jgi:hypothetical protein
MTLSIAKVFALLNAQLLDAVAALMDRYCINRRIYNAFQVHPVLDLGVIYLRIERNVLIIVMPFKNLERVFVNHVETKFPSTQRVIFHIDVNLLEI